MLNKNKHMKCLKCNHEWHTSNAVCNCPKCNHKYVKWLNYEDFSGVYEEYKRGIMDEYSIILEDE